MKHSKKTRERARELYLTSEITAVAVIARQLGASICIRIEDIADRGSLSISRYILPLPRGIDLFRSQAAGSEQEGHDGFQVFGGSLEQEARIGLGCLGHSFKLAFCPELGLWQERNQPKSFSKKLLSFSMFSGSTEMGGVTSCSCLNRFR